MQFFCYRGLFYPPHVPASLDLGAFPFFSSRCSLPARSVASPAIAPPPRHHAMPRRRLSSRISVLLGWWRTRPAGRRPEGGVRPAARLPAGDCSGRPIDRWRSRSGLVMRGGGGGGGCGEACRGRRRRKGKERWDIVLLLRLRPPTWAAAADEQLAAARARLLANRSDGTSGRDGFLQARKSITLKSKSNPS